MSGADVTLSPELSPRARWALECLAAAAGARVVPRGGVPLDVDAGDQATWDAVERGERPPDEALLPAAFFHVARVEERPGCSEDEHGRFEPSSSCLAVGEAPVDALVARVGEALRAAGVEPRPRYPGGASFAVALTHDIDTPWRWTRRGVAGAAARAKGAVTQRRWSDAGTELAGLAQAPLHRLRGTDPNWSFERFAAIERAHGWCSTSFVMVAHRDPHDGLAPEAYAARRRDVVRTLVEQGDEVGLHGSYTSSSDRSLLAAEKQDLERLLDARVRGHRFHYLRMRWHAAVADLDEIELRYDTSLGYAQRTGARAGFSFPFRPYRLDREQPAGFLELPLVLMDTTLAEARYLGLTPDEGRRVVERELDHLAAVGGCAAVLWHNDRFDRVYGRGWDQVYADLLASIERRGGWAAPAGDICEWWRAERCAC